ncbi:hypothetical protein [Spiroplasma endosymbiont of Atherix ibis]|uniref:hypothetical protein n=1 Tax=Spiroplasma endosymbiont of Atherix ibis TaxID=3066291 RepID=UPI0030CCDA07
MKGIFKGYWIELSSRVLSSKKRLIKFFGIAIIPIIYAITCILGFWNPIDNLGKAPIAIMNEDNTVWIYKKPGTILKQYELGVLRDENNDALTTKNTSTIEEAIKKAEISEESNKLRTNTGNYLKPKEGFKDYIMPINIWDLLKSNLTAKKQGVEDEKNIFSSNEIKEGMSLTNIHYISSKEEINKKWKGKKYYVDLKLNTGTLEYLVYKIGTFLKFDSNLVPSPKVKMDLWTTYERNFIFGYYMKSIYEYRASIVLKIIDKLFDEKAAEAIKNEIKETKNNQNNYLQKSWREELILAIIKYIYSNSKEELNMINFDQQGARNGIYGIGLGEFFICIGLFVGTFMQTFIYDRGKRSHNLSAKKWFITKTMLMYTTGIIQVSLLVAVLSLTGYSAIGSAALFSLWLWLLYIELIFVITIQALWFAFTDEMVSKFLVIIYLVINIAAGSGTFPSFMQFDFFYGISFLSEYRFSIQGIGSIIFGIGENGFNSSDTLYLLKQAGILAIFAVFMYSLGLLLSTQRNKEIRFGSYKGKQVLRAFEELNMKTETEQFKKQNKKGYNWNKMQKKYYPEVILKVRELYPFEGQFKWYKKMQKNEVLKPSVTDEETISRNDSVEV